MTSPVVAPPLEHSVQAITASEVPETYPTSPRGKASQPHWEDSFTSDDDDDEQIYSTDPGSSISEDAASATTSISSSIFDYQVINGRTYQDAYGKYWAPNDERACEALDLLHHLCLVILDGKLHRAPLEKKKIRNVLDIGTGTGLWAIDFADEFPEAEPSLVPPNLWFEIDDFTRPWTFPEDSVDYIHMRFLRGSVPDWHALYQNAFRATKPGGWIETHEDNPELHTHEGPLEGDGALAGWGKIFQNGSQKLGRHFTPIPYDLQKNGLLAAGFIDINCQPVQVPIWDWPKNRKLKKMGLMAKASMLVDVEGQISIMADLCGWTSEEITAYCKRFRAELESETAPVFYYQWVVWGRKPEEGEGSI
ncbi:hypothetical protein LCI18_006575 [Fusarium solani-melongenae]|uniref:Uncharacterized protein n=1 Tax=Fusarium solani subsp. cucurbitae TaxID=2747967 RepID=A0ACD3Z358_FUSSC|nr:hypothetical protein LCI18_006575 [Fusarium solani-melongenae]